MKKIFSLSSIALATTLALTACGGGSSSDSKPNKPVSNSQSVEKIGVFLDSAVQGLTVIQDGKTTTTNAEGKFSYNPNGGALTFKLGELLLGSTTAKSVITPADLQTDNQQVTRILQILQSVDSDNNPENGIQIDENVAKRFVNDDFNTLIKQEDTDKFATDLKAKLNTNQFVKTEEQAVEHFKKTSQSDTITHSPELATVADKLVGYWQISCDDDGVQELFQLTKSSANTLVATGNALKREYENKNCTGKYTESTEKSINNYIIKVVGQGNADGKEITTLFLTAVENGKKQTDFSNILWNNSNSFSIKDGLTMTKVSGLKFNDIKQEESVTTVDASKVLALITGYWSSGCQKGDSNDATYKVVELVKSGDAQFKAGRFVTKEYDNTTCSGSPSNTERGVEDLTWDIKYVTPSANGYTFTALITGDKDEFGKTIPLSLGNFEVTNTKFVDIDNKIVTTRVNGF